MIGDIIGGLGSIVGGILGSNSQNAANAANERIAQQNIAMQREFAQHGIRWKAEDARQAMLHPLFAMGASTHGFQPVSVNAQGTDYGFLGRAGQNIGRAIDAGLSFSEKRDARLANQTAQALQLNNMGLQNELLRTQIDRLRSPQNPPIPALYQRSPGGGNTGDAIINDNRLGSFEFKPTEADTAVPFSPATAAGPVGPQVQWRVAANGALQPFPPKGLIDDQDITNIAFLRWLASNEGRRPPEAVWKSIHPDAIDIEYRGKKIGWMPVYTRGGHFYNQFPGRHREPGPAGPVVTVPMPRR